MNELQMIVELNAGSITTNTEEIKQKLSEKMAEYKNAIFTEESKQIAKSELASLRKLKKDVDDRRKAIKSQCMAPYEKFEEEVKELYAIIDEPIREIDRQLREMEEERIRKKREVVKSIYSEVVAEAAIYLPYDEIYDTRWDNAGFTPKKVRESMEQLVVKTAADIEIINNSMSDVKEEALDIYKKSRDLAKALSHINTYESNKKKALELEEERRRIEEARRREEEIERVKREERERIQEIERVKTECNAKRKVDDESAIPFGQDVEEDGLPFVQPTTITAFYRVVATPEELEQVEMAFNSLGIYFERRDA